ncbi:MAG: UDP-N-acetylmuramoyl-L-alanyl-D-glutamate--2,6-diaminopimelate ligase [Deltaproteobacteria bacterium]|nr:UDP-N-acetylmuramoyl-L-alanyl-D-glutamate--2,6-diaminopimelate ligase [Deltaproteobacteria bacterium]
MRLAELLKNVGEHELVGNPDQEIAGIAYDSRKVQKGYLFVALRGQKLDGHSYLRDAVERGAVALAGEQIDDGETTATRVRVRDSRSALSRLAMVFYGHPFRGVDLVGITGTNGKTTTSFFLESILQRAGARPGVVGTINYRFSGRTYPAPVTTPESLDLTALVREMVNAGVTHVIMEVSSHALDQKRTSDCPFRVAIFTNLSRDHLDYHGTMEEYFRAKSLLFRELGKQVSGSGAAAVINMDDPRGSELAGLTDAPVLSYGVREGRMVRAASIQTDRTGLKVDLITPWGTRAIRSALLGEFNIYNILAASAAALSLGIGLDDVAKGIEDLRVVPGRMELVENPRDLALVVDYAHTPDALLKTLKSLRSSAVGRLITVFGCGGDRDKGKRYDMGLVAGQESDLVFITSDNPRSEEPLSIISAIERGVRDSGLQRLDWPSPCQDVQRGYFTEVDRREAIRKAVSLAARKDLILIAGKGHEDYQIVGGERRQFDDRREAALAVSGSMRG